MRTPPSATQRRTHPLPAAAENKPGRSSAPAGCAAHAPSFFRSPIRLSSLRHSARLMLSPLTPTSASGEKERAKRRTPRLPNGLMHVRFENDTEYGGRRTVRSGGRHINALALAHLELTKLPSTQNRQISEDRPPPACFVFPLSKSRQRPGRGSGTERWRAVVHLRWCVGTVIPGPPPNGAVHQGSRYLRLLVRDLL